MSRTRRIVTPRVANKENRERHPKAPAAKLDDAALFLRARDLYEARVPGSLFVARSLSGSNPVGVYELRNSYGVCARFALDPATGALTMLDHSASSIPMETAAQPYANA